MPMTLGRTIRRALLIAVAVVAFVIVRSIVCFFLVFMGGRHARSFDSGEWRAGWTCRCTPIRQQMAQDLVDRRVLAGASKERVIELLGEADRDPWLLKEQPRLSGSMIYELGPDHLGVDREWLVVQFGEDGRVLSALVGTD
ncbi:MAG: hypothetical protein JNN27_09020 [Planctomycetes bacterium]|nr:hypothetical protein [Planctomycetota bacterium]